MPMVMPIKTHYLELIKINVKVHTSFPSTLFINWLALTKFNILILVCMDGCCIGKSNKSDVTFIFQTVLPWHWETFCVPQLCVDV